MNKFTEIILGIAIVLFALFIGLHIQQDISNSSISYCDEKYGVCNWTYEEKDIDGFYIGEYWECVPIKNKLK